MAKTLKISEDLHRRLKIAAAQLGLDIQELSEIYLTSMLDVRARVIYAQRGQDWQSALTALSARDRQEGDL